MTRLSKGNPDRENMRKSLLLIDRIARLVENLLTLSRFDAGVLKLHLQQVDQEELIQRAMEPLLVILEIRNVSVHTKASGMIFCDPFWMGEVLTNLIKNCAEHTEGHDASIHVTIGTNPLYTEIEVRDNGKGFAEKDLSHLFERFYKGEQSDPQHIGIGLALAKQVVQLHGGTIRAYNENGAVFQIRLYKRAE